jgi:branched-chain amino acid transport system ATP-binding protein
VTPLLSVAGLTVTFGGVTALRGVDLTVPQNTIHGLVGPNGSGKTTLINAVSGFVRPASGSIMLDGHDISGLSPHRRSRRGVARSFQHPAMFPGLTVFDTIAVGAHRTDTASWLRSLVPVLSGRAHARTNKSIFAAADEFHVTGLFDVMAEVSFGHQRLGDLARAAIARPRLLLLDEPASGLTEREIELLCAALVRLKDQGTAVLVTDHNMAFMSRVCDRITVVNVGEKLAEGTPDQIRADEKVIDAYLGRTSRMATLATPDTAVADPSAPSGALEVTGLTCAYQGAPVLREVTLSAPVGRVTTLVGPNGAGKTTLLRAISGSLRYSHGRVSVSGQVLDAFSSGKRLRAGIAHVPQGRGMIDGLTVRENLEVGGYSIRDRRERRSILESVIDMFPFLRSRLTQLAGSLSGGEQQMLSIARALMSQPKVVLLDEPTLGLAPVMVDRLLEHILGLKRRGIGVLLVEQNTAAAFSVADHGYVLSTGRIVLSGAPHALAGSAELEHAYLGASESYDRAAASRHDVLDPS